MGNTFGNLFKLTSFGESHGSMIGGVIEGCPAGLEINNNLIQKDLDRRKPGQSKVTSPRKEDDKVQLLSGIFEGKSTGTPIGFLIPNINSKSKDYSNIKDVFRPSHADYTYEEKYGLRDYRGGGRSSARETVARVVAGSIAKLVLKNFGITINAYVSQVGSIQMKQSFNEVDLSKIENNIVRCPDESVAETMIDYIMQVRKSGDTIGGVVDCVVKNVPVGIGEPVFDKLHAELGKAMLSINAVKGFEYGSGFEGVKQRGSEHNDIFESVDGVLNTKTNNSGGIQGGISNGQDIYFRTAFKPVATIMIDQDSVNEDGDKVTVSGKGRHDPCVVPRAVPIVEAMAAITILDSIMLSKTNKLSNIL